MSEPSFGTVSTSLTSVKYMSNESPALKNSSDHENPIDDLEAALERNNVYEPEERTRKRYEILAKLESIAQDFVRAEYEAMGASPEVVQATGARVVPFGSFALGAHAADADIDAVCLVPARIHRDYFFRGMEQILSTHRDVTHLNVVLDSMVPVIKFKFMGISVDLLCTVWYSDYLPNNLNSDGRSALLYLQPACRQSLMGPLVATDILGHVPDVKSFRAATRCIKLWATRNGVYSNVYGFPGGVAWALMVARVCQLYPNASASTIVSKFFHTMVHWNWSWKNPITLNVIKRGPLSWNPQRNIRDKSHMMPVITPTYPNMCSTHNVTRSTFNIIMGELKQAARVMEKITAGESSWDELFEAQHPFFDQYTRFLRLTISSTSENLLLSWAGYVESKIRALIGLLEETEYIILVHPYTVRYSNVAACASEEDVRKACQGEQVLESSEKNISIYTRKIYLGLLQKPGRDVDRFSSIQRTLDMFYSKLKKGYRYYDSTNTGLSGRYMTRSQIIEEPLQSTVKSGVKRELEEMESSMRPLKKLVAVGTVGDGL